MEQVIKVIKEKIEEYNNTIEHYREQQIKANENCCAVVLKVQQLERELKELEDSQQPKKRKPRSDKKQDLVNSTLTKG